MEDLVRKEVETLKLMMSNWRRGFLTWHEPGVSNDYILKEFHEEITEQLLPHVSRLLEMEHITNLEATELMDHCYGEIAVLKKELEDLDGGG